MMEGGRDKCTNLSRDLSSCMTLEQRGPPRGQHLRDPARSMRKMDGWRLESVPCSRVQPTDRLTFTLTPATAASQVRLVSLMPCYLFDFGDSRVTLDLWTTSLALARFTEKFFESPWS